MSLICLSTCTSSSSHFCLFFSSFYLLSPPFTLSLCSHCSLLLPPLLHLFSCHSFSPSFWFHRNCWVIPVTGTAQLIGLNSFWQILSLSSCSPCLPKYVLFSAVYWLPISPSFFIIFCFPPAYNLSAPVFAKIFQTTGFSLHLVLYCWCLVTGFPLFSYSCFQHSSFSA